MNETTAYYADTAYDSRSVERATPGAVAKLSSAHRKQRENRLPDGIHCGEFLALSDPGWADAALTEPSGNTRRILDQAQLHDRILLQSPRSVRAWLGSIRLMAGIWLFFFGGGALFSRLADGPLPFMMHVGFWVIPLTIYGFCFLAMRYWTPSETHNNTMHRRTGTVYIGRWFGLGQRHEIPFAELEGAWLMGTTPAGGVNTYLGMFHRYSTHAVAPNPVETIEDIWEAALYWEYYQAFMDISRPLPDVPELEHCRHLDPVTAAHDKQTGRNPHYWRDIGPDETRSMKWAARERAKAMLDPDNLRARLTEQDHTENA